MPPQNQRPGTYASQTPPPEPLATDGAPILQVPPPKPSGVPMQTSYTIIVLFVSILAISGCLYYYWVIDLETSSFGEAAISYPNPRLQARASGIGKDIYEKVNNPIAGNIPAAPVPEVNPLEDAYKNPFQ
jgi:hypothetical protein